MADKNSSEQVVQRVYSFLDKAKLIVMDFTILMTIKNNQLLDWISKTVSSGDKKLMVTDEFYRCLEILLKSQSTEQTTVAANAKKFLQTAKENGALVANEKFKTTEALIEALHANPSVLIMFSDCSEAAELMRKYKDSKCMTFVGMLDGRFSCSDAGEYTAKPLRNVFDGSGLPEIKVASVPAAGDTIKDSDGRPVTLNKMINKGGEGCVYTTNKSDKVCKIYHARSINAAVIQKLRYLEKRQVRYEGICWPEKLVYNNAGVPVGYLMKKASGKSLSSVLDGLETVEEEFPSWKRVNLVKLAISVLEQIQYLHLLGIIVGDIRPQNIIIDKSGKTYLIDLDSCQIENFPCPVGDEDYTPAENQSITFSKMLRTYMNERFSWSVLTFVILFLGLHPYDQRNGRDTIAEEIALKTFRYPKEKNDDCSLIPFGPYLNIWDVMPIEVRDYFYGVFKNDTRPCLATVLSYLDRYRLRLDDPDVRMKKYNMLDGGAGLNKKADKPLVDKPYVPVKISKDSPIRSGGSSSPGNSVSRSSVGSTGSSGGGSVLHFDPPPAGYIPPSRQQVPDKSNNNPTKKKKKSGPVVALVAMLWIIFIIMLIFACFYVVNEAAIQPLFKNMLTNTESLTTLKEEISICLSMRP